MLNLYPAAANTYIGFELWGQAKQTGVGTFDVDCFYLLPEYDGGNEGGFFACDVPLGLSTTRYIAADSNDRVPMSYVLESDGSFIAPGSNLRGRQVFVWPNRAQKLIALIWTSATGSHNWNASNTVTITVTPRYRLARGTS